MSDGMVRVRMKAGDVVVSRNVGEAWARINGMDVLDEPTHNADGSVRATERTSARSGRPAKEKTTVAKSAAAKKAAVTESAEPKKEGSK